MCELLGVSCNQPVSATICFKALRSHGKECPDGWGLAFYPDQSAHIFKEPVEVDQSRLASFVADYENIRSQIFLCHIRKWLPDTRAYRNTHPFSRELNGKDFVFAHHGRIPEEARKRLPLKHFKPIGETDSEHVFCHLMGFMSRHRLDLQDEADLSLLEDHLHHINQSRNTKLNCLFSDGEHLLCYRDSRPLGSLYLLQRDPGYLEKVKIYGDNEIEFKFGIQKASDERACIVASRALTDENWAVLSPGSLTVLRDGKIIYPKPPESGENGDIMAEVYAAPHWVNNVPGFPDVIGMPKSLRQKLGVELGKRVIVSNGEESIELTVCLTARRLVEMNSRSVADASECHVWLPRQVRRSLYLEETEFRNGRPHFRRKYTKVGIRHRQVD